jgi:hypothetical protein
MVTPSSREPLSAGKLEHAPMGKNAAGDLHVWEQRVDRQIRTVRARDKRLKAERLLHSLILEILADQFCRFPRRRS